MCTRLRGRSVALFLVLLGGLLMGTTGEASDGRVDPTLQERLDTIDSLRMAGDFRVALARLSTLSQEHPDSVSVLWRHSILWSDYGKAASSDNRALSAYRQALAVGERAVAADSQSAWAHLAKAVAAGRTATLVSSNKQKVQLSRDVKEHTDRAIELDSTLAPAYHVRARWKSEVADMGFVVRAIVRTVYGGLPDASFEGAVADFERAIDLESRAYNHLELGKTYRAMDRPDEARTQLKKALNVPAADPFDPAYKAEARRLLEELEE